MTKTLSAIFDGKVLQPESTLDLTPNTRVMITIELPEKKSSDHISFLKTIRCIKPTGPEDWSEHLEEYIYGGID